MTDSELDDIDDYYDDNSFSNEYSNESDRNEELIDNSFCTFSEHISAVFVCDLTTNEEIAVSGGQDNLAFVWSTETSEVIFKCLGHKDSVISVKFNHSDTFLATGDMSGLIKIWIVKNGNCFKEFNLNEITWIEWHPVAENIFLYGTTIGQSNLIKFNDLNEKTKCMMANSSACFGSFLKNGKKSVVGYENGNIRIWDLKEESIVHQVKENNSILTSLCVKNDNTLIASGFLNSKIKLISVLSGKCIFTIDDLKEENNSVEALTFCDELQLLVIGYLNGNLQIWDLNNFVKRDSIKLKRGITKIVFDKKNLFLFYVASLDGVVRLYDIRNSKLVNEFTGHSNQILDIVVKNKYLISCSEDTTCKIFKLQ